MTADRSKTRSVTRYTWHECRLRSGWTQRNILTLRRDLARRAGFPTPPSFPFRLFAATYTSLGNARSSRIGFVIPRELLDSVWSSIRSLYHHISSPYSSLTGSHRFRALHFFFFPRQQRVAKLILLLFLRSTTPFFQYIIYKVCEFCAPFFFFLFSEFEINLAKFG